MRIDLHAHSTASDGTDTPTALVRKAAAAGIGVLALTDHDTTGGWAEAVQALPAGLTLLRGTELSCVSLPSGGATGAVGGGAPAGADGASGRPITLHLLGYLFDPADEAFVAERRRVRESRLSRGRRIVELLQADGYPLDWPEVLALADGGAVGRPHIGRALVRAGVVGSVTEAFGRLLHEDGPYYLPKADIEVLSAVRLVRAAGGVPVFAHPLARRRGPVVPDEVVAAMAAAGLAGLEVDHPDHEPADREHLRGLAAELGLFTTGSSDYHGANKPVRLGQELTAPAAYEQILAQASGLPPVKGAALPG